MDIKKIQAEINQCKDHIAYLESRIKEIQQSCDHQFQDHQHYEKCEKCQKVNVLYY